MGTHHEAVRGSSLSRRALLVLLGMTASAIAQAQTVRIDVTPLGVPADRQSLSPVVSYDGRYVAFLSGATNLVEGDIDNSYDFFRYDRQTGEMIRGDAVPFIGGGFTPPPPFVAAISQDGRWLLFHHDLPSWVPNDTNHDFDSFQYDFATGNVRRVTVGSGGAEADGTSRALSMSADGRYVAFHSNASNIGPPAPAGMRMDNVFVHDTQTLETVLVSRGVGNVAANGASVDAVMSPDGEWVAFTSAATNLTSRPDTNGVRDVFVAHWRTGDVLRVQPRNGEANQESVVGTLSWDGREVVFCSTASNLVPGQTGGGAKTVVWNRLSGAINFAIPTTPVTQNDCSNFELKVGISRRGRDITIGGIGGLLHYGRDTGQTLIVNPGAAWHETSGTGQVVVFGRDNGVYAWAASVPPDGLLPATDSDSDGLPDIWEEEFRLDPFSGQLADGPDGDPDADGVSNLGEFQAGTHPKGTFRRFLAEGASGPFFSTRIALFNPARTPTTVVVRLLTDAGRTVNQTVGLAPHGVYPVNAEAFPGVSGASFSIETESDALIVVERTMTWDSTRYGAHSETALAAPSMTWYFAEGSTSGDFNLFYLLQNPQPDPVTATVRFLRPFGLPFVEKVYTLPPRSRTTIYVDTVDPVLESTDVGAVIMATQPIVAERAMYWNRQAVPFAAGHASAGATAPALTWFLAEGATGTFFDTFVLLLNPTNQQAICEVRYLTRGGVTYTKTYTLDPDSRTTIWVDEEVIPGMGAVLRDAEVSTTVTSLNNVPIVVERAMWWPSGDWQEAHASTGVTAAGPFWAFADGETGGSSDAQTYLLIANMSPGEVDVLVTVYLEGGGELQRFVPLHASSRVTINMGEFPFVHLRPYAATVLALHNEPMPLVVERATYWSANGVFWAAGTNAVATPLPWTPPPPPNQP